MGLDREEQGVDALREDRRAVSRAWPPVLGLLALAAAGCGSDRRVPEAAHAQPDQASEVAVSIDGGLPRVEAEDPGSPEVPTDDGSADADVASDVEDQALLDDGGPMDEDIASAIDAGDVEPTLLTDAGLEAPDADGAVWDGDASEDEEASEDGDVALDLVADGAPEESDSEDVGEDGDSGEVPDSGAVSPKSCSADWECVDGDPCTYDYCYKAGVCHNIVAPESCDDGDPCTNSDHCKDDVCLPGWPTNCNDLNPCTADSCNSATGACVNSPVDPTACDDDNLCTSGDTCQAGTCIGKALECDDADPCTQDHCYNKEGDDWYSGATLCTHVLALGCIPSPCGECPEDLGFTCVDQGGKSICLNVATDQIYVPAGVFWIGCNPDKMLVSECEVNEGPQTKMYVPAFAIDRLERTAGQAKAEADAFQGGMLWDYLEPTLDYPGHTLIDHPELPMNYVAPPWFGWICENGMDHCSEAQWEKAAIGGCLVHGCAEDEEPCCRSATPAYPWGDELDWTLLGGTGPYLGGKHLQGASPYGVLDMMGNMEEYTSEIGWGGYSGLNVPPKDTPSPTTQAYYTQWSYAKVWSGAIVRGPNGVTWDGWPHASTRRVDGNPASDLGFRCCKELP